MDRDPLPFDRGYQEVLGALDGARALRAEIRSEFTARAGAWDYVMIALGSIAAVAYRVLH